MSDDLHSAWAGLLCRCFASAGVRHAVVSPGSRSTPLALAALGEPGLSVESVIDERSAAFFALGQARVTGQPSLLVCTSGSAAGHYLPAIMEAARADVPLIALTADRPSELTHAGANQTLDQVKLFGSHVRASFDLGSPEVVALEHLPRIVAQAKHAATSGPVHVNARFRKPLEPVKSDGGEPWRGTYARLFERGAPRVFSTSHSPSAEAVTRVAELVAGAERPLLVAGPFSGSSGEEPRAAVRRLRRALARFLTAGHAALVAEATSGLLHGPELVGLALGAFDAWLPAAFAAGDAPDLVIELGAPATSGAWLELLGQSRGLRRVVVSSRSLFDPAGGADEFVLGDAAELFERVGDVLGAGRRDPGFRQRLGAHASRAAARVSASDELSEPAIARGVASALPDGAVLVIGNSLPVRDLDLFGGASARELAVLHQRGASGIDGIIAGAAGAASALPVGTPVLAFLGDVAAAHDVGSLALAAARSGPLVIVVVNNGGGRIFEQLPVARAVSRAALERLFLTPPALELEHAARSFGLGFARATTRDGFEHALESALARGGATLLEAVAVPELGRRARAELTGRSLGP